MLALVKMKLVEELITTSSKEELIWLNGYLAGIVSTGRQDGATPPVENPVVGKLTIVYGTETGNSKKLATEFSARAKKTGVRAKVTSLDQYRVNDLLKEEYFLIVLSTHGDGEPPAASLKFFNYINENQLQLNKLKYSVLALGDTAYPLFCKAGEDVDARLQQLGATRIGDLQKCDVDYEDDANNWFNKVIQSLSSPGKEKALITVAAPKKSTGKKWYKGNILGSINLNDRGSQKETFHMEIAADGLDYQPGDAIGIIPENKVRTVEAIISIAGINGVKEIDYKEQQLNVFELLQKKLNIIYLPERVVQKYAAIVQQEIPSTRMDLLDLLKIYPVKSAEQFEEVLNILEPIAPRLYSISSSPQAHTGEVHITVAKDNFCFNDETKNGLCSYFLTQLNTENALDFYIHKNNQFRLPAEDKPVIMVGPGTGIAPFRSFLAERDAMSATGENWLFFGDQHFVSDFLYQTEMQTWMETGVLTKIDLAFSRDQKEKVYVQHKMLKQGEEFFNWLQKGAYVYVCGAKHPMSEDVEKTLLQIICQFGERTADAAIEYLQQLKEEGRYLKDVY
jgi:sulfite reductase (NADPH) flavoprotein alpha-component